MVATNPWKTWGQNYLSAPTTHGELGGHPMTAEFLMTCRRRECCLGQDGMTAAAAAGGGMCTVGPYVAQNMCDILIRTKEAQATAIRRVY